MAHASCRGLLAADGSSSQGRQPRAATGFYSCTPIPCWRPVGSEEVCEFQGDPQSLTRAATFRFAVDDACAEAKRLERLVAWRVRSLGLAYGDQGLVIHRQFYSSLGGFQPWPLMEDVDLVRRIGRHRLVVFRTAARTSAERWRRDGWHQRSLRNFGCLALYALGIPPPLISRLYD